MYKAKQFIDAIPGSGGIIKTIANRVGCDWNTARKYIREYPTVAQAYDDECETVIDMAESTVIQAIRDKDVSTAKWYLRHKARDRGYVERQEVTGADGGPVPITIIDYGFGDATDDYGDESD